MSSLPSFVPNAPIETPRLRLRLMTYDDIPALVAIRVQPAVNRLLSHGAMTDEQIDARLRLRVARMSLDGDAKRDVALVVTRPREDGDGAVVVGDCGFTVKRAWTQNDEPSEHLTARIHYALSPIVAGQGLGTEVVSGLVRHLFTEPRVHRVQADVFAENTASRRVLEKNGFRQEGYFRDDGLIEGRFLDACVYSLLRREWNGTS